MLLDIPIIGFIVVLLAAALFFAEFLVSTRGVFLIVGTGLFLLYFVHHLSGESPLWLFLVIIIGIILIILDGKLINHGFVALVGLLMMLTGVVAPVPSAEYGILAGLGFTIGTVLSFAFIKVFPVRTYWKKLTLKEALSSEAGYNSVSEEYRGLKGMEGHLLTPCRPTGTAKINGKPYSVITSGGWLETDTTIKVVSVDGTRVLVEEARQEKLEN